MLYSCSKTLQMLAFWVNLPKGDNVPQIGQVTFSIGIFLSIYSTKRIPNSIEVCYKLQNN